MTSDHVTRIPTRGGHVEITETPGGARLLVYNEEKEQETAVPLDADALAETYNALGKAATGALVEKEVSN